MPKTVEILAASVFADIRGLVADFTKCSTAARGLSLEARDSTKRIELAKRSVADLATKVHLGEATPEALAAAREEIREAELAGEGIVEALNQLRLRQVRKAPQVDRAEALLRDACLTATEVKRAQMEAEWSAFQVDLREQIERELGTMANRHGEPIARSAIRGVPLLANLSDAMARAAATAKASVQKTGEAATA